MSFKSAKKLLFILMKIVNCYDCDHKLMVKRPRIFVLHFY